jgi:hypothetical protein
MPFRAVDRAAPEGQTRPGRGWLAHSGRTVTAARGASLGRQLRRQVPPRVFIRCWVRAIAARIAGSACSIAWPTLEVGW